MFSLLKRGSIETDSAHDLNKATPLLSPAETGHLPGLGAPAARESLMKRNSLERYKIFLLEISINTMLIGGAMVLVWLAFNNLYNGVSGSVIIGDAPNSFTTSSSSQGFYLGSMVVMVPITSVVVLISPWLITRAKKARCQLQLLYLLYNTTTSRGARANDILEAQLRTSKISLLNFTSLKTGRMTGRDLVKRSPGYGEFFLWLCLNGLLTSGITSLLVIPSQGLSTVSNYGDYHSLSEGQIKSALQNFNSCLYSDWLSL
ncbi:hypothetical protein HDU91_001583, partial [Kappamyces sp. JEL0680]